MDKKGIDGKPLLPHYPYRDDGMLVWNAIETFVSKYLNHFYPNPSDIIGDSELQAWAAELSNQTDGGKVKGMPPNFTDVKKLIGIVTTIIFICGPQHSAVNYGQDGYMTFAANMPLAAYRDIPKQSQTAPDRDTTEQITDEQILKLLPPYKRTADQLQNLFILSAYRYDQLGDYDKSFQELYRRKPEDIFDSKVIELIKQFQQDLNIVEKEIDASNKMRIVPYPYLKPSLILNSISI